MRCFSPGVGKLANSLMRYSIGDRSADMSASELNGGALRTDWRRAISWSVLGLACLLVFQAEVRAAQIVTPGPAAQEVIGRLSGDDASVKGAIGFENENGRTTALLTSGSDITLRSGEAKVDLREGGDIILCGPAHLSIVKSGTAITIALDYGQVHLHAKATAQITIYTPLLIVTAVGIGDRERDFTVGLDENSELCVMALSGAMRIEEQFTRETLIVPQGGDVQVNGGELRTLRSDLRTCSCELLTSENNAQKQIQSSVPAHPSPNEAAIAPTYRIDMPPLTFNSASVNPSSTTPSSATSSPALTSEVVQVIRESVSNPPLSFRGAVRPALPPPPAEVAQSISRPHNSGFRLLAKLFGMFHRHRQPASEQSAAARS